MRGVRPNSPIHSTTRVVQHAALVEIFDQRAHGLIELAQLALHGREDAVVHVPAAQIDLDEGHALFDQPAGHQAAVGEAAAAVHVAHLLRLAVDLEGPHLLAGEQRHGLWPAPSRARRRPRRGSAR